MNQNNVVFIHGMNLEASRIKRHNCGLDKNITTRFLSNKNLKMKFLTAKYETTMLTYIDHIRGYKIKEYESQVYYAHVFFFMFIKVYYLEIETRFKRLFLIQNILLYFIFKK